MSRRVIAFVDHEIGYRLLDKIISTETILGFKLVAVVTTDDNGKMWWPGVSGLCLKNGIPLYKYNEPFNDILDYANIDWYFLISWKHIIPSVLISYPRFGVINLHYSLLPEYRGVYPVNRAIIDGREKTGVTFHLVDEKIDHGQIICQKETSISLSDTARSLQLRLDDIAYELFDKMVDWTMHVSIRPDTVVHPKKYQTSYMSHSKFIESNELNLTHTYRAIDLLNLLRGKTHMPDSKNLYVIDSATGNRIYISISLTVDEVKQSPLYNEDTLNVNG